MRAPRTYTHTHTHTRTHTHTPHTHTHTHSRAKTHEESAALRRIEQELAQIDAGLSHDIAILRDRIEGANREYVEARQRFDAAEAECVCLQTTLYCTLDHMLHVTPSV
jgi:hypothetical protein